jgi:hypothetical protein
MQERRTTKGCSKICKISEKRGQHTSKDGNHLAVTCIGLMHTLNRLTNSIDKLNKLNK